MTEGSTPRETPQEQVIHAWHPEPGSLVGSRRYTSNDHPDWSIHDSGTDEITINYRSATIATRPSVAAAIEWVESIPADWTAEPGPCAGTTYYNNPFYRGWTVYDAGPEHGVKVYHHGEPVAHEATVPDGIQQVEHSGQIPIRRREDAPFNFSPEHTAEELKALMTVEVTERGMRLAIQFLGDALSGPVADVPRKVNRAITMLSLLTGETSDRTCTAVKQMDISDNISAGARHRLAELVKRVDEITEKRS